MQIWSMLILIEHRLQDFRIGAVVLRQSSFPISCQWNQAGTLRLIDTKRFTLRFQLYFLRVRSFVDSFNFGYLQNITVLSDKDSARLNAKFSLDTLLSWQVGPSGAEQNIFLCTAVNTAHGESTQHWCWMRIDVRGLTTTWEEQARNSRVL